MEESGAQAVLANHIALFRLHIACHTKTNLKIFEMPYFYAPQAGTTSLPHIDINNFALLGALTFKSLLK